MDGSLCLLMLEEHQLKHKYTSETLMLLFIILLLHFFKFIYKSLFYIYLFLTCSALLRDVQNICLGDAAITIKNK